MKRKLLTAAILNLALSGCAAKAPLELRVAPDVEKRGFAELRTMMEKDGLSAQELKPFDLEELEFRPDAVKAKMLSIVRPMRRRAIGTMDVSRGRRFLMRHAKTLASAEKESGVPNELIVSVIWIETNFGSYVGRFPTLDSLASLATLKVSDISEKVAQKSRELAAREAEEIKARDDDWKDVNWQKRTEDVGDRWYSELKAFLKLCSHAGWEATELSGSWAGAIGYGQFLPSVALAYMLERPVDLWDWNDMIPLIARELSKAGWGSYDRGGSPEEVISRYNAPRAYTEAVLEMRKRLADSTE